MHAHRDGAMPLLFEHRHRRMLRGIDMDYARIEVAKEQGLDREKTNHERWNRKQDQRQGHDPGRLMGFLPRREAMMFMSMGIGMSVGMGIRMCASVSMRAVIMTLTEPLLAVKDQEHHPERVERRHEYASQHCEIGKPGAGLAMMGSLTNRFDDGVLRIEARQEWRADQGQRTDQRRDPRDRHIFAQATHIAHVLIMMHPNDDRARGQEQKRLEEGVGHQVKDGCRVGRRTECNCHVAELGQGRVGDDPLDIVLNDTQEAHEERRDGADHDHKRQGRFAQFEERTHACHHKDTGGYHRGGVNQRRDRGRSLHGIRQPDVQRELRTLAHGTDEKTDTGHGQERPLHDPEIKHLGRFSRCNFKHRCIVETAEMRQHQANPQRKTKVPHPVHQESLEIGVNRSWAGEPEPDEQIRNQSHRFPAEEELDEVVRHHEHEHREGEQADVGKETLVTSVLFHVPNGVDVDHQRHECDHAHHGRGQGVDQESDLKANTGNGRPLI